MTPCWASARAKPLMLRVAAWVAIVGRSVVAFLPRRGRREALFAWDSWSERHGKQTLCRIRAKCLFDLAQPVARGVSFSRQAGGGHPNSRPGTAYSIRIK